MEVDLELALNESLCHVLEMEGEGGGEAESQHQADPLIVEDHGLAAGGGPHAIVMQCAVLRLGWEGVIVGSLCWVVHGDGPLVRGGG